MKNGPVYFITACVILCLIFAGCVASTQEQEGSNAKSCNASDPESSFNFII